MINTSEDLARFVVALLQHRGADRMDQEMYQSFLTCYPTAVDKLFWIYELTTLDGKKEWVMEYSLANGGGWVNMMVPYEIFMATIDSMLKWDMEKEAKDDLLLRKQSLMEYFYISTTKEKI